VDFIELECDADELTGLAMAALEARDHAQAFACLQNALAIDPEHGTAHHLLGVLHAALGRVDLAIPEMERAITLEIDPTPARFELGLMHLSQGAADEACAIWEPLRTLDEDHYLFRFQRGFRHLQAGRFDDGVADLTAGIARNDANPALSREIEKLIQHARRLRERANA